MEKKDIYQTAADKLNEFLAKYRILYKRRMVTNVEYYEAVTNYIQALVDNDLIGAGYGEQTKAKVSQDAFGCNEESFPYMLGEKAEMFHEGQWVKGIIHNGYRFKNGIVSIKTGNGTVISCSESRKELYRKA